MNLLKNFKQFKAFTLIELIVVLLLSVIVFQIGYLSFRILSQQFLSFEKKSDVILEASSLQNLLIKDFESSNVVKVLEQNSSNTKIACVFDEYKIVYVFGSDQIKRIQGYRIDSFNLIATHVSLKLMGINKIDQLGLIDEINFSAQLNSEEVIFTGFKQYGAEDLINDENNDLDHKIY